MVLRLAARSLARTVDDLPELRLVHHPYSFPVATRRCTPCQPDASVSLRTPAARARPLGLGQPLAAPQAQAEADGAAQGAEAQGGVDREQVAVVVGDAGVDLGQVRLHGGQPAQHLGLHPQAEPVAAVGGYDRGVVLLGAAGAVAGQQDGGVAGDVTAVVERGDRQQPVAAAGGEFGRLVDGGRVPAAAARVEARRRMRAARAGRRGSRR